MKSTLARYLAGFFAAAVCTVLLQNLYALCPGPVTALFAPVCRSPWELGKLLYWPMLPGILTVWSLDRRGSGGSWCALLVAAPLTLTVLALLTQSGRQSAPAALLWPLVLGAALAVHALLLRKRRMPGGALLWYLLAVALGVCYVLGTVLPLPGVLFQESAAWAPIPF